MCCFESKHPFYRILWRVLHLFAVSEATVRFWIELLNFFVIALSKAFAIAISYTLKIQIDFNMIFYFIFTDARGFLIFREWGEDIFDIPWRTLFEFCLFAVEASFNKLLRRERDDASTRPWIYSKFIEIR